MRDRFDRVSILEGDNAGEGYVKIQVHCRLGDFQGFGEAVHYPADLVRTLFAHNAQRVLAGGAGMDDQRFSARARGADMRAKPRPLPFQVAVLAIIIQAGFADGDNLRVSRELDQISCRWTVVLVLIRMHANRSKKLRIAFGQCQDPWEISQIDANA